MMFDIFWIVQHLILPAAIYRYDPFFGLFIVSLYATITFGNIIATAIQTFVLLWMLALYGRVYQLGNPEKVSRLKQYLFVTLPEKRPTLKNTWNKALALWESLHSLHISQRFADGTGFTLRLLLERTEFEDHAHSIAHFLWPKKVDAAPARDPDLHIMPLEGL